MSTPILRLGDEALAAAVEAIAPVEILAADLVDSQAAGRAEDQRDGVVRRWPGAEDLVLVAETEDGGWLVAPESGLRAVHAAALAALAARELLAHGPVHSAVLGMGATVQPLLTMIARRLPAVCRIVVYPATVDQGRAVGAHAIEQIDLAGVELRVTDDIGEAVYGARLVIVTGETGEQLTGDLIGAGLLVVNVSGAALPAGLVASADQYYVDDRALLAAHDGANRTVDAEFAQVIAGTHPGRTREDDVVVADLLDAGALNQRLAASIGRAARELGLSTERID